MFFSLPRKAIRRRLSFFPFRAKKKLNLKKYETKIIDNRHAGSSVELVHAASAHLHCWRRYFPPRRRAYRRQSRRAPLSANPTAVLGASHQDVQSPRHEHYLHLRILEHPRAGRGKIRLYRQSGRVGVLSHRAQARHVRHCPSRTIRLRRMGDGRPAVVASEKKRHPVARSRPVLHATGQDF